MPQSLAQIYLHIVFSTKNRHPFLVNSEIRREVHEHMARIATDLGAPCLQVGGVEDHVHLLCRFPRTLTVASLVRQLKRETSYWLKYRDPKSLGNFYWQDGYGVFSISPSHLEPLIHYIRHQEEHHKTVSFKEEYLRLLKRYEIDFNPKFLWD